MPTAGYENVHYHIQCYRDLASHLGSGAQAKIFIFWLKESPEPSSQFDSKETTKNTERVSQRIHFEEKKLWFPFF